MKAFVEKEKQPREQSIERQGLLKGVGMAQGQGEVEGEGEGEGEGSLPGELGEVEPPSIALAQTLQRFVFLSNT